MQKNRYPGEPIPREIDIEGNQYPGEPIPREPISLQGTKYLGQKPIFHVQLFMKQMSREPISGEPLSMGSLFSRIKQFNG